MLSHAVAHATWHTCECLWWRDIGHSHTNHSLAVARCCLRCNQAHLGVPVVAWHRSWPHQSQLRCCMRLHMQPGTLEGACGGMVSVHTNHSLAVACRCMRLHMQPGTLVSAGGGMTPFMATPITGWLWHAVACGSTCNLAHLRVPLVA